MSNNRTTMLGFALIAVAIAFMPIASIPPVQKWTQVNTSFLLKAFKNLSRISSLTILSNGHLSIIRLVYFSALSQIIMVVCSRWSWSLDLVAEACQASKWIWCNCVGCQAVVVEVFEWRVLPMRKPQTSHRVESAPDISRPRSSSCWSLPVLFLSSGTLHS